MAVYFFDKEQRVSKILTDNNTLSSIQTQELSDDLLIDYLTVSMPNNENVTESEYMAVKAHEGNTQAFDMYRVINVVTQNEITTFTGIQLAYYELAGYVVEDIRPTNQEVATVATQIVAGTEWRVGYVAPSLKKVSTNFYYISAKEAFEKLQEVANCEVVFKVEISGTGVIDKWVEIYKQLGDKTLKRFNYGSNALTIEREIGKNDIYTALIGLGKGEEVGDGYGRKINFSDIEWKKSSGKPVDKPIGQKYIELPEATAQFGIKTKTGNKARIGVVDFGDIEDKNELIQATYDALIDTARPKVQFKTTVLNIGETNIGDTVTIHRHDLDIHYMARVFKVVRDKLNDDLTQIELGDAISQSSTKRQSSTIKLIDTVKHNLEQEVNLAMQSASGKNVNNYGNDEPTAKRTGDLWYRDHPSIAGERQMLIYDGTAWVEQEYRADMLTGTFNAKNLTVINVDADSIATGTLSGLRFVNNFARNGVAGNLIIDGDIRMQAGDTGFVLDEEMVLFDNGVNKTTLNHDGLSFYRNGEQVGEIKMQYFTTTGVSAITISNAKKGENGLRMIQNRIEVTERNQGANDLDIFLIPSGDGKVLVSDPTKFSWKGVRALDFELPGRSRIYENAEGGMEIQANSTLTVRQGGGAYAFNVDATRFKLQRDLDMSGKSILNQSDERLKKNIVDTEMQALKLIDSYRFVDFEWKKEDYPVGKQFGLIAQETEYLSRQDSEGIYSINSSEQIMLTTKGVQELHQELNETKQELADLKALLTEKGVI